MEKKRPQENNFAYGSIPVNPNPVILSEIRVQPLVNFGPSNQNCVCPFCHAHVLTTIKRKANIRTHAMAACLCIFFCPFMFLPYFIDSCQNTDHYCPNCAAYLGTYS